MISEPFDADGRRRDFRWIQREEGCALRKRRRLTVSDITHQERLKGFPVVEREFPSGVRCSHDSGDLPRVRDEGPVPSDGRQYRPSHTSCRVPRLLLRPFMGKGTASIAELERNLTVDRTRAALRHKIAKGERVGRPPFGWAAIGEGTAWLPVDEEQVTPRRVHSLREAGATFAAVADTLASEGVPMKLTRGRWHPTTVRRALISRPPKHELAVARGASHSYPVSTI